MYGITAIEQFLRRDKIQDLLAQDNLDEIYEYINYNHTDFSVSDFTDYLYGIDIDPLDYVTKVHDYMYSKLDTMAHIHIPGHIKSIGEHAFTDCVSMEEVIIDEGVKQIDSGAFTNCYAMEKLVIPSSVEEIELFAFFKCNLRKLVIYCKENSVAHQLAVDMGINFELM